MAEIDVFVPQAVKESEFSCVCGAVQGAFSSDDLPVVSCRHHDDSTDKSEHGRVLVLGPDINFGGFGSAIRFGLFQYFRHSVPIRMTTNGSPGPAPA